VTFKILSMHVDSWSAGQDILDLVTQLVSIVWASYSVSGFL
jgi:hypothetical protein